MSGEENPEDEFSDDDEDLDQQQQPKTSPTAKGGGRGVSPDQEAVLEEMQRLDQLRREKTKGQSASIQRLLDQGIINRVVNNPTSDGDVVVKAKLVHDIIGLWEMGELAPDYLGVGSKTPIETLAQLREAREIKESYCRTFDAILADKVWDYSYVVNRVERYRRYGVDIFVGEEMEQLNALCRNYHVQEDQFERLLSTLSKKLHEAEPAMNNIVGFYLQDAEAGRPRGRFGGANVVYSQ